jgi:small subunit ribosomal protein YMR-31
MLTLTMLPGPQPQRPHPAAPAQLREAFSDFLEKYKSFSSPSGSLDGHSQQNLRNLRFKEFWEAPEYLWRPKTMQLEDSEIDAVLVSLVGLVFSLSMKILVYAPQFCRAVALRCGSISATSQV